MLESSFHSLPSAVTMKTDTVAPSETSRASTSMPDFFPCVSGSRAKCKNLGNLGKKVRKQVSWVSGSPGHSWWLEGLVGRGPSPLSTSVGSQ